MTFYDAPRQRRTLTSITTLVLLVAVGGVVTLSLAVKRVSPQEPLATTSTAAQPTAVTAEPVGAVSATFAAILTNQGDLLLQLYPDAAPQTVKNFATLAAGGYYNDLTFHRIVKDFVIQGGDPNGDGSGGTSIYGETFEDEINPTSIGLSEETQRLYAKLYGYTYRDDLTSRKLEPGAVAMANRGANTNGSQFFIVSKNSQPKLDGKHTVFGQVIEGMPVVETINGVEVGPGERPVVPVVMRTVLIADDRESLQQKVSDWHAANDPHE